MIAGLYSANDLKNVNVPSQESHESAGSFCRILPMILLVLEQILLMLCSIAMKNI